MEQTKHLFLCVIFIHHFSQSWSCFSRFIPDDNEEVFKEDGPQIMEMNGIDLVPKNNRPAQRSFTDDKFDNPDPRFWERIRVN